MTEQKIRLLGMEIDNLTLAEATSSIIDDYASIRKRAMITTPNVDVVVQLDRNSQLRQDYAKANMILADGAPIILASRLLGTPLKERVAGADIFPLLCEKARDRGLCVMLLGGGEGVAQKAAANLAARYPGLEIHAYTPSFGFDGNPEECNRIIARINELRPHLLFLGVGTPRQERWIASHQEQYCPCVSIGIGGSLDFEAGRIKRAPLVLRKAGLEWLFRLAKEPARLYRRYLVDDRHFFSIFMHEAAARRHDERSRARG